MTEADDATDAPDGPGAPRPEELRFFGTTWVSHSGSYWPRRVGVALGSLLAAAVGALVLRLAYQGLDVAGSGGIIRMLMVVGFAICSSLALTRTLSGFTRRREPAADPAAERSLRSLIGIGFIGLLLAYFLRSLVEAPGEKLLRADYDRERELYERRRTTRTGNPARKKRKKKR
jgi:hypothetical protein